MASFSYDDDRFALFATAPGGDGGKEFPGGGPSPEDDDEETDKKKKEKEEKSK